MSLCESCILLKREKPDSMDWSYCRARTGYTIWIHKGYQKCKSYEEKPPK